MTLAHEKKKKSVLKKIREGSVTHKINALFPFVNGIPLSARLNASKQTPTHYTTLEFGFPYGITDSKKHTKAMLGEVSLLSKKIQAYEILAKHGTGKRKELALQVLKGLYIIRDNQTQKGSLQYEIVKIPILDRSVDGKIVLDSESFRIVIQTQFFGVEKKWLLCDFNLKKGRLEVLKPYSARLLRMSHCLNQQATIKIMSKIMP
jgi:hypothetical protein